jgi:hypothetical protein
MISWLKTLDADFDSFGQFSQGLMENAIEVIHLSDIVI